VSPRRALLGALLAVVVACSAPPVTTLSRTDLYVDPASPAAVQAAEWEAQGRTADAARMRVIAAQPIAQWLTSPTDVVGAEVTRYVQRARSAGQRPLLVAYHVPGRDCGSFSSGGAPDAADYGAWIRKVAAALDGGPATVVLEPDAVPQELTGCVPPEQAAQRAAVLSDAVDVLASAGDTAVYIDAGNPGFAVDPAALAGALRRSGIDRADGFSLNVANFWSTQENVAFGTRLSGSLGGAHFVVDTSRNGNGPLPGAWCNPPGRALGTRPTTSTGEPALDAYLWIKRPGESDGECGGGPAAGQWWPDYAVGLARNSRT
jgi:endoglucanase